MINIKLDGKAKATVSKTAGISGGSGGPVPAFQWNNSMTMTDEIMEKLVNRELELYWGQNRYLYVTNYIADEGLESEYTIYRFGEAPSIDTYSDRIYINTIEFKKQWGTYFVNDHYFNQYQALPIIEVIGGQVSGSTLTVRLDNDYSKEKFNNNWVSVIHFSVTAGGVFSNLMCYFRAYGNNKVYYISPLSGTTYYEVVVDIPDFSLEAPDLVFTVEFKDIANMLPAMSFPELPGEGTSYRLTVGDKGDLTPDEAFKLFRADIIFVESLDTIACCTGESRLGKQYSTTVKDSKYYEIVLQPGEDYIDVSVNEVTIGGSGNVVVFDMDYYNNSEPEEEVEAGPILLAANNSDTWNNAKLYEEFNNGKICFIKYDWHRAFVSRMTYFSGVYTVLLTGDTIEAESSDEGFGWDQENQCFFCNSGPK